MLSLPKYRSRLSKEVRPENDHEKVIPMQTLPLQTTPTKIKALLYQRESLLGKSFLGKNKNKNKQ